MDYLHGEFVTHKEILTEKYNFWLDLLVGRASSLQQAELEKKRDPSTAAMLQTGHVVSMHDLVEFRKNDVREAKQYLQVLDDMLEAESGRDLLENFWSDETLKPVPNVTMSDLTPKEHQ